MSQVQSQQRNEPPKSNGIPGDANTYYVLVPDENEERLARAALESAPRGSKIVTELRLQRLGERHNVICVYRNEPKHSPGADTGPDGRKHAKPSTEVMRFTAPIQVEKFFTARVGDGDDDHDDDHRDGDVDELGLVRAIAAKIHPLTIRYRPDSHTLKIVYV